MRHVARLGVLSLLLGALVSVGCAAPTDDEVGDGADAVTLTDAAAEDSAKAARATTDELARPGFREGAPVAIPLQGEAASREFSGWKSAAVLDGSRNLVGFMMVPKANAPAGSFGVVFVDPARKVVALSAYVPDGAKDGDAIAARILAALPADAAAAPAALRPAGIATALVVDGLEMAMRVLSGLSLAKVTSKAVARTEAHLAARVDQATWKAFSEAVGDRAEVGKRLAQVASERLALGSRKVVLVEAAARTPDANARVLAGLERRYAAEAKKMAIVARLHNEHVAVVRWALDHDVPVTVTMPTGSKVGPGDSVLAMLDRWARIVHRDPAAATVFQSAMADPKKAGLIRVIEQDGSPDDAVIRHLDFVPLWVMAEEAFGVRFAGQANDFFDWFGRFEHVSYANY